MSTNDPCLERKNFLTVSPKDSNILPIGSNAGDMIRIAVDIAIAAADTAARPMRTGGGNRSKTTCNTF